MRPKASRDAGVATQTLPGALEWLWQGYVSK
jgi:hypothetical protein